MTRVLPLLAFLAILSLTNSTPLLAQRDTKNNGNIYFIDRDDLGGRFTGFGDKWPTCANDELLIATGVSTNGKTINTQPDCDAVIAKICNAVDLMVKNAKFPYWLSHTEGTCEGHIMFGYTTFGGSLNYEICADKFQSITETCMLIDDNIKNHAADGQQAGVLHVYNNPVATPPSTETWSADTSWSFDAQMPGYMMGAPGTFGKLRSHDSDCIQPDGSLREGC